MNVVSNGIRVKFLPAYIMKYAKTNNLSQQEGDDLFTLVFQQGCVIEGRLLCDLSVVAPDEFSKGVQAAYQQWSRSIQSS